MRVSVCVHTNANRERNAVDQVACGNTRSLSCGPVPVLLSLACLADVCVRFLAHQVHHQPVDFAHVMGIAVSSRAQVAALPVDLQAQQARAPAAARLDWHRGSSKVAALPREGGELDKAPVSKRRYRRGFSRHGGRGAPTARERPSMG